MEDVKPFIIPEKWRFIEFKNKEEFIPDFNIIKIVIDSVVILIFKKKSSDEFYIYGTSDINKLLIPKVIYGNVYDPKTNEIKFIEKNKAYNTLKINNYYCFEIINYLQGGIINFISTHNELGCNFSNNDCKGLNYLMNVIFKVLVMINFNKDLYLLDYSSIGGISLLLFNLITGKGSVFCKYGFTYTLESIKILEQSKEVIQELKEYLYKKGWKGRKIDQYFLQILSEFNKPIGIVNILMLNEQFKKGIKPEMNCNFNQICNWSLFEKQEDVREEIELPKVEEDYSLPMSLDFFEDIPDLPRKTDIDIINEWINNVNIYINKGVVFNQDIADILLPLDINFNLFNHSTRKDVIKLFNKLLYYYGLELKSKPVKITDTFFEKKWIQKGSEDYSLISRILVFLILSGLRRLSYHFLVKLLDLYKKSEEKITKEDFKKWNEIVGTY